jgi:fumarate hydratase class II
MSKYRVEKDSLGEVHVPIDALWGAQTQRAVDNFPVSGQPMPAAFCCCRPCKTGCR